MVKQHIANILRRYGVGDECLVDWSRADRLASIMVTELGLTKEWGLQYDSRPTDVVLGRECNPDGTVTKVMKLDDEAHARQVMNSPAPLSAVRKSLVSRFVSSWVAAE